MEGAPWVEGESRPIKKIWVGEGMPGVIDDDDDDDDIDWECGGVKINIDGAKYHLHVTNPSPTKGSKRDYMVSWLDAEHPGTLTDSQKIDSKQGGLTCKDLWRIIEPLRPEKNFAVYDIARKYGHEVFFNALPSCLLSSAELLLISL